MLPVFKEENHYNYGKEAFNLLLQSNILSPRKLAELKWSRTINTHGKPGHNVPCDLHMEHLNRGLSYISIYKQGVSYISIVLTTEQIFCDNNNQSHSTYNKQPLLHSIIWEKITDWVEEKLNNTSMYC